MATSRTRYQWILFLGTPLVALLEWLMFELLRTPYRPPEDMLTLLGREKYELVAFMCILAAIWGVVTIYTLLTARMTTKDYLLYTAVLAAILSMALYMVRNPNRPVTPWELLWS